MSKELTEVEQEARRLSASERAKLAHSLIASLDVGEDVDAEEAWLAEAERRYQAYREGKIEAKPAKAVFDQARPKLT